MQKGCPKEKWGILGSDQKPGWLLKILDCPGKYGHLEGIPIRTTLDNSTTVQYAGLLHQLTMKAKSTVRDIDPQNDLTFLRIRSKKHEIMVAPELPTVFLHPWN
uniref:Dynein light chain roadblock-type 2 n=1 Tax=Podarcis muralis TaxID=64176 RepID=A0A670IS89_PODMU